MTWPVTDIRNAQCDPADRIWRSPILRTGRSGTLNLTAPRLLVPERMVDATGIEPVTPSV